MTAIGETGMECGWETVHKEIIDLVHRYLEDGMRVRIGPGRALRIAEYLDIEVVKWHLPRSIGSVLVNGGVSEAVIYVNRDDPPTRQQFHIAHELGHCILHPRGIYAYGHGKDRFEREANIAAAEILMPEVEVRRVAKEKGVAPATLSRVFGVSRAAMRVRIEELGLSGTR